MPYLQHQWLNVRCSLCLAIRIADLTYLLAEAATSAPYLSFTIRNISRVHNMSKELKFSLVKSF